MQIRDLGEFGLINRISQLLPPAPSSVVVGIGDDVAVLKVKEGNYLIATCDVQIENIHFVPGTITSYQLGKKIAAINISDIAAMGGTPDWALVSLVLPENKDLGFVDELYNGMQEQLTTAEAAIVGGNVSRANSDVMIDLFLMGHVAPANMLCRNGAKEGDLIFVTGTLGDSRAGLELIRNRGSFEICGEVYNRAICRHLTPQPRLREGQALGRSGKVNAMVDVSDGLMADLGHICEASQVGAEIWAKDLPTGMACAEVSAAAGADALEWALTGGEDYELLFVAATEAAGEIERLLLNETGTSCRVIGRIVSAEDGFQVLLADGSNYCGVGELKGWDHFAKK